MAAPLTVFTTWKGDDPEKPASRVEVEFPSGSISAASLLASIVETLIEPLVYGSCESVGFTVELSGLSVRSVPDVLADIRDKALFVFDASGAAGIFPKKITLPTYNENFTLPGTSLVDQTDADVSAFIDALINGITVSSVLHQPCDTRAYDLVSVRSAEEVERS